MASAAQQRAYRERLKRERFEGQVRQFAVLLEQTDAEADPDWDYEPQARHILTALDGQRIVVPKDGV